jgi:hypothetical protein
MMRAAAIALALLLPAAHAQSAPRTPDGRPDFQGVWSAYLLTPFERQDVSPTVKVTGADADAQLKALTALDDARAKSQLETEGEEGLATDLALVDGSHRTALVVDPPDGRIPRGPGYPRPGGPVQGPESYPPYTRCIVGAGVAPLLIGPLDMLRRVVQTPDAVTIHSENQNDLRILRLGAAEPPAGFRSRTGYSRARWEGDVLVVDTTHFGAAETIRYQFGPINHIALSPDAKLTERFELAANGDLIYRFTVADPVFYTAPWSAEYNMRRSTDVMIDAGCHEANYSLAGMLRGAVIDQKRAAAAKK